MDYITATNDIVSDTFTAKLNGGSGEGYVLSAIAAPILSWSTTSVPYDPPQYESEEDGGNEIFQDVPLPVYTGAIISFDKIINPQYTSFTISFKIKVDCCANMVIRHKFSHIQHRTAWSTPPGIINDLNVWTEIIYDVPFARAGDNVSFLFQGYSDWETLSLNVQIDDLLIINGAYLPESPSIEVFDYPNRKSAIINYLYKLGLSVTTDKSLLIVQQVQPQPIDDVDCMDSSYAINGDDYASPAWENFKGIVGDYPAIFGAEFRASCKEQWDVLIDVANKGSLITICHHPPNPYYALQGVFAAWDGYISRDWKCPGDEMLTPGTPLNLQFLKELDSIAVGFKYLQDHGVILLYRPWHEYNGKFFWWCDVRNFTDAQFIQLYRFTRQYMETTHGLHNLIWCVEEMAGGDCPERWPGDDVVDIVSASRYDQHTYSPSYSFTSEGTTYGIFRDRVYAAHCGNTTYNKPYGLAEWGTCGMEGSSPADLTGFPESFKTQFPRATFMGAWDDQWAFYKQNNLALAMQSPIVVLQKDMVARVISTSGATTSSINYETLGPYKYSLFYSTDLGQTWKHKRNEYPGVYTLALDTNEIGTNVLQILVQSPSVISIPGGGTFYSTQTIMLTSQDQSATIYYTLTPR